MTIQIKNHRTYKSKQAECVSTRPYNNYNLFFFLERQVLRQASGLDMMCLEIANDASLGPYADLKMPPFPPRYSSLVLPHDWFVHGKKNKEKRVHTKKMDSVASFTEMTKIISSHWKNADEETVQFVRTVAGLIKDRHHELNSRNFEGACDLASTVISTTVLSPNHTTPTSSMHEESQCYQNSPIPAMMYSNPYYEPIMLNAQPRRKPIIEVDLSDNDIIAMWSTA